MTARPTAIRQSELEEILHALARDLGYAQAPVAGRRRVHSLPVEPGAYVLLFWLARPAPLPPRFGTDKLAPGFYAYCGSARGPGGLQVRIARHLAREKSRRWHIDWLTTRAGPIAALAVIDGNECALRERLSALPDVGIPVPGFGSTDCTKCPSHLVRVG
ncbi:MAG: DUF123 domain-containing protein [Hyphomicrobiales bacterium]|nr:MAG: DUF123 domain-containing protein [Hyphomicrobiales bacterium]